MARACFSGTSGTTTWWPFVNRPIHLLLAELGPLHEDMEGPDCLFDVDLPSLAAG